MAGSGQPQCVCVCVCRVNCRLGGATYCLPYLWSRVEPLGERWSWWHVVPVTGRLAPDSTLLPLELREPAGLPLDRHRDAGTAFILGGGLVPDTLSALPPTLTHHHPPLPTLSTQITANTHTPVHFCQKWWRCYWHIFFWRISLHKAVRITIIIKQEKCLIKKIKCIIIKEKRDLYVINNLH